MNDITIIGGGIVGLATALQLLENRPTLKIAVLEKENTIAKHQTGHNSGVIHSGIYYKPNSLKANNCVQGYKMLLDFCDRENVPYDICGKIIVATRPTELPMLKTIYERGVANGLQGLTHLTVEQMHEIEPNVSGLAAIRVPQTGIIDYVAVAHQYAKVIQRLGGEIFMNEKVIKINKKTDSAEVITENKIYPTRLIINCSGLYSDKIASLTRPDVNYKIIPFRGEYYKLTPEKRGLVKHLVYPVPDPNFPFLGVHFTRMINGEMEAGPNAVFAFRREGYTRSAFHLGEFFEAIAWRGFQKVALKYWRTGLGEYYRSFSKAAFTKALQVLVPAVRENDLIPAGAGVRAQACDKNGGLIDDFLILEEDKIINVGNAPSPAATSSLAIGKTVAEMALKRF